MSTKLPTKPILNRMTFSVVKEIKVEENNLLTFFYFYQILECKPSPNPPLVSFFDFSTMKWFIGQ